MNPAFRALVDHLLRQPRDEEARAVLQDLLLETYPEYAATVDSLRRWMKDERLAAGCVTMKLRHIEWAEQHRARRSSDVVVRALIDGAFAFDFRQQGERMRPLDPGEIVVYTWKRPVGRASDRRSRKC